MRRKGTIIPFRLRGLDGGVEVEYLTNEDPGRWGYPLLEGALGFSSERTRGFPVVSAGVRYPGEGYGALMGWVQLVWVRETGSVEELVVVDKPPQLAGDGSPYCFWGINPSFFDAPSTTARLELWSARAFLVASPDALMTREVRPACGFSWGYSTSGLRPEAEPAVRISAEAWSEARVTLAERYPAWRFGDWWHDG